MTTSASITVTDFPSGAARLESGLAPGTEPTIDLVAARRGPALPPAVKLRDHSVLARQFMLNTVARAFDIELDLHEKHSRGRAKAAFARQAAMYLAHVACGLSLTAVGHVFGRDRSTVSYACRRIEEARDAAPFDHAMGTLERSVRMIIKASPALRRDLELEKRGQVSW